MDYQTKLRINLRSYQNLFQTGKQALAYTYLPAIRECCTALKLEWEVVVGIKNGYIFQDLSVPTNDQNPEIAVLSGISSVYNCEICGKPLKGKRSDAKVCGPQCKKIKNESKN